MKRGVLICLFLTHLVSAHAQYETGGIVLYENDLTPAAGINVMLFSFVGDVLLSSTLSDSDGYFRISHNCNSDSLRIRLTGMDIKMKEILVARDDQIRALVSLSPLAITAAKKTAPPISGRRDTLVFSVAQYLEGGDKVIADVIKRMPGIAVEENGRVYFDGKPVRHFYIEGMDMLGERYGVATNSIDAEQISSIEVYKNYQPVTALRELEQTDYSALNLKLKDSCRGVLSGTLELGGGYKPALWSAGLTSMYFGRTNQALITYKGNNEGSTIPAKELLPFSDKQISPALLSVSTPGPMPMDESRYLFNNIHTVSANVLQRNNSRTDWSVRSSYAHDSQEADGFTSVAYYFPDGFSAVLSENIHSTNRKNEVSVDIKGRKNIERLYWEEALAVSGKWDNSFAATGLIDQEAREGSFNLDNLFTGLFRIGNQIFSFKSDTKYRKEPQQLDVSSFLFTDNTGKEGRQNVTITNFFTENELRYSLNLGGWQLRFKGEANVSIESLQSQLVAAYEAANDVQLCRLDYVATLGGTYNLGSSFYLTLELPLDYRFTSYFREIESALHFIPRLSVKGDISGGLRYNLTGYYAVREGDVSNLYTNVILTDYHTLIQRSGSIMRQKMLFGTAGLSYEDPFAGIIASLSFNYLYGRKNLLSNIIIDGVRREEQSIRLDNDSHSVRIGGRISKRFNSISTTVNLAINSTYNNMTVLRQGSLFPGVSKTLTSSVGVYSHISSRFHTEYDLSYTKTKTVISKERTSASSALVRQALLATYSPFRDWRLSCKAEHYFNSSVESDSRNVLFADLSISFQRGSAEYSVAAKNLLNYKQFDYTTCRDLMEYHYVRSLRPLSVMAKIRYTF